MKPRRAAIIAMREFSVRVHSRSYLVGTLALVIATAAIAFAPVIVQALDRGSTERIAVYAPTDISDPTVASLGVALNVRPAATSETQDPPPPDHYVVTRVPDLTAGRADVVNGTYAALLAIRRSPAEDLDFTLYTNANGTSRTSQLVQQAAAGIAISDRLGRSGIRSEDQAALFVPPAFQVQFPDPAKTGAPVDTVTFGTRYLLGFGMSVLILMMVILYGQWIAMSVVEEKTSRVMEVVLNAASPLELLTGKVLGVGSVALLQYLALLGTGLVALFVQGPVANVLLGGAGADVSLPEGLSAGVLLVFGVYGVLGFLLYGVLYAAAGSMVSRQEDVQTVVMPLALISTAGYLVAVYGSIGLVDSSSTLVVALAQVPFLSPFMMIGRATSGALSIPEFLLSVALLVAAIAGALVIASRLYAAGVLLYGQRPGIRSMLWMVRHPA